MASESGDGDGCITYEQYNRTCSAAALNVPSSPPPPGFGFRTTDGAMFQGSIGYSRGDLHPANTIQYQQHIKLVTPTVVMAQKHDDALSSDDDIYYSDDELCEEAAAGIDPVMYSTGKVDPSSRQSTSASPHQQIAEYDDMIVAGMKRKHLSSDSSCHESGVGTISYLSSGSVSPDVVESCYNNNNSGNRLRQISIDEEFWQQDFDSQEPQVNKENSFESCSTFYSTAENVEPVVDDNGNHESVRGGVDPEGVRCVDSSGDRVSDGGDIISNPSGFHKLKYVYCLWYSNRHGGNSKNYSQKLFKICSFGYVEEFWSIYAHLVRPDMMFELGLKVVSDLHVFREGIRPLWEDEANKRGGKWMVRLGRNRSRQCSIHWENLVLAMLGEQFIIQDEICGVVVSARYREMILALWNKTAADREITQQLCDRFKRVLNLGDQTVAFEYKAHQQALKDERSFMNTDVFVR